MTIILKKGEELDVRAGAPWIYDNEIAEVREGQTGAVAEVLDQRGRFVARGFYHGASKIALRVLTRSRDEAIDRAFFRRRLAQAWEYRRRLGFDNACRVVFGESDGLPGLTVDKFGGYLSFQITSFGLEQWKPVLIDELAALLKPRGIFERDDVPVREKEGLPQLTGCVYGAVPDRVEIREHDAWMYVDRRTVGGSSLMCPGSTCWISAAAAAALLSTPCSMARPRPRRWTCRRRRWPLPARTPRATA